MVERTAAGGGEIKEGLRQRVASSTRARVGRSVAAPMAAPRIRPAPEPWPDPRRLSARQMAELGHRLYVAGYLDLGDSRLVSAQPELHPGYASTIGRLTGCPPAPDRPRDHVADWGHRLAFVLRHTPDDDERIDRIRRILSALGRITPVASASACRMRE